MSLKMSKIPQEREVIVWTEAAPARLWEQWSSGHEHHLPLLPILPGRHGLENLTRQNDEHRAEQQMRQEMEGDHTSLPGKSNSELGQARPELGEGVRGLSLDGSLEFYLNCRYFKAWK